MEQLEAKALDNLIREGASLKNQIDLMSARLREINTALVDQGDFNGKKSANLAGAGFRVRIQLRELISYDQGRLSRFREHLPVGKFAELFKTVYEPTSKRAVDGFLEYADPDLAAGLRWCMTIKSGSPYVTYEPIEEAPNAPAD